MLELEIVGIRCLECEMMVGTGENHACWSQELGMVAFEDAMWKKWKEENAIEPVKVYIAPWSDAKEGDKLNTEIGQDCSLCPPGDNGYHQYKIKVGCFVKGHPACAECASAEEISQSFAAGEIQPLGPADIGMLADPRREEF